MNSKSRPDGPTFKTLEGIEHTVVIEPHERELYAGHNVAVVPESGKGLPYSRQFALDLAQRDGLQWYWVLDDDIKHFSRREGTKLVRCDAAEALGETKALAEQTEGVAQVALEYAQFAWSAKKAWKLDSYADVAVANNAALLKSMGVRYDTSFPLKGDRDFTIQCIAAGARVARTTKYAFVCPKNGSNLGGLQDTYATTDVEKVSSEMLARKWGWCVTTQTKPDGRQDAKIHWKKIVSPPSL